MTRQTLIPGKMLFFTLNDVFITNNFKNKIRRAETESLEEGNNVVQ